jgi:hypothetical protein
VGDGQAASGLDNGRVVARGAGADNVGAGGDGLDCGGVRSNGGGLDGRRRNDGVASSRAGGDGVASRRRSGGGARDGSDRAGGNDNGAAFLGDTELSRVLVLAGDVVDQLESVVGGVGLERGGRGPGEGAGVLEALNESLDGDNVGRGATEQEERDRVGGGWLPGDGEGLASRDNLGGVSWLFLSAFRLLAMLTSFKGRVMGLPEGSPTAGWSCAAAMLAKKATTEALVNMLMVGIM